MVNYVLIAKIIQSWDVQLHRRHRQHQIHLMNIISW